MNFNQKLIKEAIIKSLVKESDLSESEVEELAFHMIDWIEDLSGLAKFYNDPSKLSDEDIYDLLMSFLIHVPEHIAAAGYIMMGSRIKYIFEKPDKKQD